MFNIIQHFRAMVRLGTDYRIDAGLIAAACAEFFLALFTALLCFRGVSESCGLIDQNILTQIVNITVAICLTRILYIVTFYTSFSP